MNNLLVSEETFTNGYMINLLDIFFILSIFSGILVIINKNPIVSVLFLISLFLSVASYIITLGISFIGLSYLLVYVGAVSILFIFILMLINVRISELFTNTSNSIPLGIITAISFTYIINQVLPNNLEYLKNPFFLNLGYMFKDFFNDNNDTYYLKSYINTFDDIVFVTGKSWDGNLAEATHITTLGNIMYTNYSIWLIITSIILLLAMVGAIIITIKQKS